MFPFIFSIIFLLLLPFSPHPTQALEEFGHQQNTSYLLDSRGNATVTETITLTNLLSRLHPQEYIVKISGLSPQQITITSPENKKISHQVKQEESLTTITVKFLEPSLGKGQKNSFTLAYLLSNFAKQKGQTWEIILPEQSGNPGQNSELILKVPETYGTISYATRPPKQKTPDSNFQVFTWSQTEITPRFLVAFGQQQIFSFNLSYFLQNHSHQNQLQEIPLPPDTPNQKIYFQQIHPTPQKIVLDQGGNWLAKYSLKPSQSLEIKAQGQAQVGPNSNPIPAPTEKNLDQYLKAQKYWPVDNPIIQTLAQKYFSPQTIYNFVIATLFYPNSINPNSIRQGALAALENPQQALCTEFTDLFISISRAANIPAREIEGFAWTDNPQIKPILSQDKDILHAWPQYYDQTQATWISIDPTWQKTTGGIDYFHHFDLNHLTFVIHGLSSESPPPPGSFRQSTQENSVQVNFAQKLEPSNPQPLKLKNISRLSLKKTIITFQNPALQSSPPQKVSFSHHQEQENIPSLPPLGEWELNISTPPWPMILLPRYRQLKILLSDQENYINYPPYYFYLSLTALAILFTLIFTLLFFKAKLKKN